MNVCTRTLAKDNHRPCIPTPIDPTAVLPGGLPALRAEPTMSVGGAATYPPSIHWQKKCNVDQY